MLGYVLFGCVEFQFSEIGWSFRLDWFCLSVFGESDIVLVSCSLFIFWSISSIPRSKNQPFFIIVLTCCLKTSSLLLDLYPLWVGLLQKLQCHASWLSSQVRVLCLCLLFLWFLKSSFTYLKRTANICRMTITSLMLAIRRAPADHDNQACCLGTTLRYIFVQHFYHGWYSVAIPDPGFFF